MPTVTVKPHPGICPEGATFEVDPGISVCDAMLQHGVPIEHACEKSCACTTCHVHIRTGGNSLDEADELVVGFGESLVGAEQNGADVGVFEKHRVGFVNDEGDGF